MNTPKLTNQIALNIATDKLIEQGRAAEAGGSCLYRAPDGCRCAIGWVLPDDKYREDLESNGIGAIIHHNDDIAAIFADCDRDFLGGLQDAHDYADGRDFRKAFSRRIVGLAKSHGLTVPESCKPYI